MKVILTQDIDRLGKKGDIINVKDGFARNYLIPKGMALQGTESRLHSIESIKAEMAKNEKRYLMKQQKLADKLATLSLKAELKMGVNRAFGAITNADVAVLLKEAGYEIDRHKIVMPDPIKETGIFNIPVHLDSVTATIKLWVTPKE